MSELDAYLLVTFFCSVCGFFIGLGQKLMRLEKEEGEYLDPGARVLFALASLVGMGYLTAWLWVSYQPVIKLIPVFIIAAIGGWIGSAVGSSKVSAWLAAVGIVLMPVTFHAARYFSFI